MTRTERRSVLFQAAARARIDQLVERVSPDMTSNDTAAPTIWALGDYHRFAKKTVWELGPVLVQACGISPGQRVLDVAAGSGNVALRAAEAGADVVASDVTPENFDEGRREAEALGVELEWVEADVESLPFDDDAFDVVTSSFGAMFAPDHYAAAAEMLRVCRRGGTIGMLNFTPEGLAGLFFGLLTPYLPPPPVGALPPLLWGSDDHVRSLFGGHVDSLELTRNTYVERAENPSAYRSLFEETFGPVVAIRESIADQSEHLMAFDHDLHEYAESANSGVPGGDAEYVYEYLLVVARKGGA